MGVIESCGNECDVSNFCSNTKDQQRETAYKNKLINEQHVKPTKCKQTQSRSSRTELTIQVTKLEREKNETEQGLLRAISQQLQEQKAVNDMLKAELAQHQQRQLSHRPVTPLTPLVMTPVISHLLPGDLHLQNTVSSPGMKLPVLSDKQMMQTERNKETYVQPSFKQARVVRREERELCMDRVAETISKATTTPDIQTFIMAQYRTVNAYDLEDRDSIEHEDEEYDSSHTSLDMEEKLEIEHAKVQSMQQEDIMAMQDELRELQRESTDMMKDEISVLQQEIMQMKKSRDSVTLVSAEETVKSLGWTTTDGEQDTPYGNANLFRCDSGSDWNDSAVTKQKKEMQAAMAHLVQTHVSNLSKSKSTITPASPK